MRRHVCGTPSAARGARRQERRAPQRVGGWAASLRRPERGAPRAAPTDPRPKRGAPSAAPSAWRPERGASKRGANSAAPQARLAQRVACRSGAPRRRAIGQGLRSACAQCSISELRELSRRIAEVLSVATSPPLGCSTGWNPVTGRLAGARGPLGEPSATLHSAAPQARRPSAAPRAWRPERGGRTERLERSAPSASPQTWRAQHSKHGGGVSEVADVAGESAEVVAALRHIVEACAARQPVPPAGASTPPRATPSSGHRSSPALACFLVVGACELGLRACCAR